MLRIPSLLLTFLLASAALAGCALPGGDDDADEAMPTPDATPSPVFPTPEEVSPTPTPTPATATPTPPTLPVLDSSTYALAVAGQPGQAKPGTRWNFTLFANGSVTQASDHVGAHYADNDTTDPPTAPGRKDCEHPNGELPGVFTVHCAILGEGTWHVWGHARINDSGELRNWWTADPFVVKVRDYALNTSGFPTNPPTSNQNFTFTLAIVGADNATSTHLGAHYWNATEANPTVLNSAGACAHAPNATASVDTHTVTCAIPHTGVGAKDFFVRGHLRLTEGATTLDWWSPETKVAILGVPATPLP